jgi:Tol biopolymer transport system component
MTYSNTLDTSNARTVSIFLRDATRNIEHRLTDRYGITALAEWSPDGQHIAYLSLNDELFTAYIMDALGHNKRSLGLEFSTLNAGYVWSPDSQWILFSVSVAGIPQSVVVNVATGRTYVLPQVIGAGMWSPDSQTILYHAAGENSISHFYGLNVQCLAQSDSCAFKELDFLQGHPIYENPVWSPDGHAVAFGEYQKGIIVARLRCADVIEACLERYDVIGDGQDVAVPIWSADSQHLAFVSGTMTSSMELNVVDLATGEKHTFNTPAILPSVINWSPNGKSIAYLSTQTGVFNVYLLDTLSGESRPLFFNKTATEFPTWRPTSH